MEEEKTENANVFKVVRKKKNDNLNKLIIRAKEDSIAQFQLGVKYYNGDGVEQNYEEALKWFTKSAENGNLKAQYNLAFMYESGEGVKSNIEEAKKWYKMASDKGDEDAKAALKELSNKYDKKRDKEELITPEEQFQFGFDCYKDQKYDEALKWFTKSAERGNSQAQYNLAVMYESGEGVKVNIEEAKKWYKMASDKGDEDAKEALKELTNKDEELEEEDDEELEEEDDEELEEEDDKELEEEDNEELEEEDDEELEEEDNEELEEEDDEELEEEDDEELEEEKDEEKLILKDNKENKGIPVIPIISIIILIIGVCFIFQPKSKSERHSHYSSSNYSSYTTSKSSYDNNTNSEVSAIKEQIDTKKPKLDPIKYTEIVLDKQTLYKLGYNPADKKNFTSVKIPYTFEFKGEHYKITKIGEKAFFNYGALQKVTIEEGVQILGVSAFENCTALTTVTLPSTINKINNNVFANCKSLKTIKIPYGITELRDSLFYTCTSLSNIEIPSSVISIGDMAFYKCQSLKKISLPNNLTYIGYSAFAGCRGLEDLDIPTSVRTINKWAFSNCVSLNRVSIPDGVTSIGDEAFCNVPYVYYDGSANGQPWGALDSNKMPIIEDPIMLGGITIGDSVEKVKEIYGMPERISDNYLQPIEHYFYYDGYLTFDIMTTKNIVLDMNVLSPDLDIKTPHGIKVGDSESKLLQVYGDDLKLKYNVGGAYVLYEKNVSGYRGFPKYLEFTVEDGKIKYIYLSQDMP